VHDLLTAVLLGIIEGVTEFLPVSSTGHLLIAEQWLPRQSDLFNTVIQCGAVLAVLAVFSARVKHMLASWREPATRDYLLKLLLAFGITGVGGLALKKAGFELPKTVAPVAWATLIGGGLILLIEAWLRHKPLREEMTWSIAIAVGVAQLVAATFPGTSRSGITILTAIALGINRSAAAEFSFLLGVPTLLAAGSLQILSAWKHSELHAENWGTVAVATFVATVSAFGVVKWLMRFVQTHTFIGFGWYRIGLGIALLVSQPVQTSIITFAGTGQSGFNGDGGRAVEAKLNNPYGITLGPDRALYICDMENHVVRKVSTDGRIATVAGTGKRGYSGDGGPATRAELNEPYEVRCDKQGNLFFVEMRNHIVRRVDGKSGQISTVAGNGQAGFSGDNGPAIRARLNQPHSIQFDSRGDLFICDIGNHRIRKVELQIGMITTFVGIGERAVILDGAKISGTPLNGPRAIDFDREGNLWLALREGNSVYKFDMKAGIIHHVAGTGEKGFTGNGGPAKRATLSGPKGISVAPNGNIYLADTESHSIRMIDVKRGRMELIAGTGEKGDGPEGDPLKCKFSRPHGIFVDGDGNIFIGDSEAHRVRMIPAARR